MKRLITICAVIGLMLAVTGTAGADVVWTITIQHNGGALDGNCTPSTGYLYDGGIFSGWVAGASNAHDLTADGVPTDTAGQLHGKVLSNSYVDLNMRLVGNDYWPYLPTNANASHTFDMPYISSVTPDRHRAQPWGERPVHGAIGRQLGRHVFWDRLPRGPRSRHNYASRDRLWSMG